VNPDRTVTARHSSLVGTLRTLGELGRISNLPTIWSNCLAGWLLGGGGGWPDFAILCAAASLLYTGGMFLNDAVDVDWDRQYRKERPVPSGRVGRGTVTGGAVVFLGGGWLLLLATGQRASLFGMGLVAAIVLYDLVHKRVPFAPLLVAACRWLLYATAASAAANGPTRAALLGGLAMAAYVAGLGFVARRESTDRQAPRWALVLLVAPVGLALLSRHDALWPPEALLVGLAFLLWTAWCCRFMVKASCALERCVGGLLAGIPLADGLAAAEGGWRLTAIFAGLFVLARLWQRLAPAT
jgi:4-hydroxybenzoate polyprenyltransferase